MRKLSVIDQLVLKLDHALRTVSAHEQVVTRKNPAADAPEANLSAVQKQHIAALMRINHVGEVCAQALYQGQAITARSQENKHKLECAADEEMDHLAWCEERIHELDGRTSYLNPFWYTASLMIGIIAGLAGDGVNLGFLAETERQVEKHLDDHLKKLPLEDEKTRRILLQMREDEIGHAVFAEENGAVRFPWLVKKLMQTFSRIMTTTAYWI